MIEAHPEQSLWDKQTRLNNLKEWILIDPGRRDQRLHRVGERRRDPVDDIVVARPANATQAAILAKAQRRGITASVEQREHSRQEIEEAVTEVVTTWADGVFDDFPVDTVSGLSNFDGFVAGREARRAARRQAAVEISGQ